MGARRWIEKDKKDGSAQWNSKGQGGVRVVENTNERSSKLDLDSGAHDP
jgi:hypothetical protein